MAPFPSSSPLFFLFLCFVASLTSINGDPIPSLPNLTPLSFHDAYTQLFGDANLALRHGGKRVRIALNRRTVKSLVYDCAKFGYLHGFFSAAIKLPPDYAAGVVVAFYMSNGDVFEKTHDELDFEFLGNIRGREWRVQTNVYGNGSTSIGREERYSLWFDPTEDFHQYAILWSSNRIIFYIDDIPIREVVRTQSMGGQFPSKPMSLYATIWDGSSWATSGGRYKVNYKYAPYVAEFTHLILRGCTADPTTHQSACQQGDSYLYDTVALSVEQQSAMDNFREKHMTYGYCYDRLRYLNPPTECSVGPDADLFLESGEARGLTDRRRRRRRQAKRRHRTAVDNTF